jgi:galactokinase/mevalonate kinase-like predicted kinase
VLRTAVFNAEVQLLYKGGGCQLNSIYFKRTPRVFAVEIRKYHQTIPLERYYVTEQCKIVINYKQAKLEQCKQTIPIYNIQCTRTDVNNVSLFNTFEEII